MEPRDPAIDPRAANDGAFPKGAPVEVRLRFLLNYAVLAPSVLNTQPWRFRVAGDEVWLYADRDRQLRALDPDGRELVVSCGAALMNLRLAARHHGFSVAVEQLDDPAEPDLLAVLRLGKPTPPTADEDALFHAIERRRTERRPFAPMPVPAGVLRELRYDVEREGAHLHALTEADEKAALAEQVADAIRRQGADPAASAELGEWLRAGSDPRADGVPDAEENVWGRRAGSRTAAAPLAVATRELAATSPALLVLATSKDDRAAWFAAGQALERALLRATTYDLAASYLNQAVEVAEVRIRLVELVGGTYPQVVFRVGHPIPHGGTPRRRVADVGR